MVKKGVLRIIEGQIGGTARDDTGESETHSSVYLYVVRHCFLDVLVIPVRVGIR